MIFYQLNSRILVLARFKRIPVCSSGWKWFEMVTRIYKKIKKFILLITVVFSLEFKLYLRNYWLREKFIWLVNSLSQFRNSLIFLIVTTTTPSWRTSIETTAKIFTSQLTALLWQSPTSSLYRRKTKLTRRRLLMMWRIQWMIIASC